MNDQKTFFKPEGRNTLGGKALRRYTTGFTYTSFVGKRKIYKSKKQKTKNKKQNTKQRFIKTKNKKQKTKQNKILTSQLSSLKVLFCISKLVLRVFSMLKIDLHFQLISYLVFSFVYD